MELINSVLPEYVIYFVQVIMKHVADQSAQDPIPPFFGDARPQIRVTGISVES